jgi:hypothetical protein
MKYKIYLIKVYLRVLKLVIKIKVVRFINYFRIIYYYSWIYKHYNVYILLCICWILNTLCIIIGTNIFEYKIPFMMNLFHILGLIVIFIFQLNKLYIHLSKDDKKKKIMNKKS